ncbi:MAG: glycosyltransferase [Chloroflexi bacterium]|nr:MAG: glycosyltransferase [Chloroflexota bacterium]
MLPGSMDRAIGPAPSCGSRRTGIERVGRHRPVVDVVVPVFNEEEQLAASIRRFRRYLDTRFPLAARITIADNASTDSTWWIAQRLEAELEGVRSIHLDEKGRGRALRAAWSASDAAILAYTDVDLSTDLDALLPLVAPLLSGHSEVAIGSRLAPGSSVTRGLKREVISRCYNTLLRTLLGTRFRDAQCGFKAIRFDVARRLLPLVIDDAWFFDTELLVLAQRAGLRIHEVPVDWVDDPDSRVDIQATALADLRGIWRLMWTRTRVVIPALVRHDAGVPSAASQARRFAAIGVVSTLAYLAIYSLLRTATTAVAANAIALIVTAVGNTAANRRLTFGVRGRESLGRHHLAGLVALGLALSITSASVALLGAVAPASGGVVELAALAAANGVATLARFQVLRWVLVSGRHPRPAPAQLQRTVS